MDNVIRSKIQDFIPRVLAGTFLILIGVAETQLLIAFLVLFVIEALDNPSIDDLTKDKDELYHIYDKLTDTYIYWFYLLKLNLMSAECASEKSKYRMDYLTRNEKILLTSVLTWRTFGVMIFLATGERRILVLFPNFFDFYLFAIILHKQFGWDLLILILIATPLKIYQEIYLHIVKGPDCRKKGI